VVDGSGLENRQGASPRGFESHPLRHIKNIVNLPCYITRVSTGTLEIRTRFDWWGALRARVLIPHLRLLNEFQKEHAELENEKQRNADLAHRVGGAGALHEETSLGVVSALLVKISDLQDMRCGYRAENPEHRRKHDIG
jgi:hypothetical protein